MTHVRPLRLIRSSALSIAGQALPLMAALLAIPGTIDALGAARFGALSLVWALIGAFSFFDFGLGRALTQLVASEIARGRSTAPPVTHTVLHLILWLGVVAGVGLLALTPFALPRVLPGAPELYPEVRVATRWLVLGIPAVLVTTGLGGVLTAFHQFGRLTALRIPIGMLVFLAPWAAAQVHPTLPVAVGALVVVRLLGLVLHVVACRPLLSPHAERPADGAISAVLRFGAWMTVANLIAPLMLYLDRFAIATLVSAVAVAQYVAPYDIVTRLLLVTGAVSGVLFPAFAAAADRPDVLRRLLGRGVALTTGLTMPALLAVVALAPELLRWWLSADFAIAGVRVVRWLAVGVAANCVAQVCQALIHGLSRPKLTAVLLLTELPFYVGALWFGIRQFGAAGAAMAWTVRVTVDAIAHVVVAWRLAGGDRRLMFIVAPLLPLAAMTVALPALLVGLPSRIGVAGGLSIGWLVIAWRAWRQLPDQAAWRSSDVRVP